MELKNGFSNWLEINRGTIVGNINRLLDWTGVRLMAVVKANAYGHGLVEVVRDAIASGASYCGVARIEEAIELRRAGIDAPILVLGYTPDERLKDAIGSNITLTIFQPEQMIALESAASGASQPARVHLKVDTGMSRLGAPPAVAFELLQRLTQNPNIQVEGIFTHFARADEKMAPTTAVQEGLFVDLIAEVETAGLRPPLIHAANSAATLTQPNTHFDMVRIGIALYGLTPSEEVSLLEGMEPALAWKARLSHVQTYPPGSGVSYGHAYTTSGEETLGVVPVGYGDGYRREKGNQVLIHGRKVQVVGKVCMDQLMVRLDEVQQAKVGDEVVLIGSQGEERIRAEELAARWGTFNYEVVCGLSARVPREYI